MKRAKALRERWRQQQGAIATRAGAKDSLLTDADFRSGVLALAAETGIDDEVAIGRASRFLDEMVSAHSDAVLEFSQVLAGIADRRAFEGVIQYDEAALDRLAALDADHTLVVATAHRSYLDFVVRVPFARNGFSREYRFAGANILFWPMGPIGHSFGIIFIRRGFRDPIYTFVLRQYVAWLAENRCNFMWALEGGRTRTGKLLAPKAGLLAYVADAYVEGRASEVSLVPTTVVYEYLNEVFEYAAYGRGARKVGESLLAFVRFTRDQRRVPAEAKIFVAVGQPVSLGQFVNRTSGRGTPEFNEAVTRAALETCRQIDAVTPVTSVALVLLALLQRDGVRMTVEELVRDLDPTLRFCRRRRLPLAEDDLGSSRSLQRGLDLLTAQRLVTRTGRNDGAAYEVTKGRHLEAAFYRNGIVHFFAIRGLIEIALVRVGSVEAGHRVDEFWQEVDRLRALLQTEFFFPDGAGFHSAVAAELASHHEDWQETLESERSEDWLLGEMYPFFAPRVLAPFLEAYKCIADGLCRHGDQPVTDERYFLLDCLAQARLELSLGRLQQPDAASLNMFDVPLRLAAARGLIEGSEGSARRDFADQLVDCLAAVSELSTRPRSARSSVLERPAFDSQA